jgi:hypothetical protein
MGAVHSRPFPVYMFWQHSAGTKRFGASLPSPSIGSLETCQVECVSNCRHWRYELPNSLHVMRNGGQGISAQAPILSCRQIVRKLLARLAMISAGAFCFRLVFSHVSSGFGLAIPLRTRAVVNVARGIHPYQSRSATSRGSDRAGICPRRRRCGDCRRRRGCGRSCNLGRSSLRYRSCSRSRRGGAEPGLDALVPTASTLLGCPHEIRSVIADRCCTSGRASRSRGRRGSSGGNRSRSRFRCRCCSWSRRGSAKPGLDALMATAPPLFCCPHKIRSVVTDRSCTSGRASRSRGGSGSSGGNRGLSRFRRWRCGRSRRGRTKPGLDALMTTASTLLGCPHKIRSVVTDRSCASGRTCRSLRHADLCYHKRSHQGDQANHCLHHSSFQFQLISIGQ